MNVPAFNLDGVRLSADEAPTAVNIVIAIVGMNERTEMHSAQLVFGIAEEGAESRVALLEPPTAIRYGNAGEGVLIEIAKSRLAVVQSTLGPLAVGYIVAGRDGPIDPAIGRAQRRCLKRDPSDLEAESGVSQVLPHRLARKAAGN